MANERTMKVTTSQTRCFKQCRKRYFFEYVECLKPIETPSALDIGRLYHNGLENLLKGESIDNTIKIMEREARSHAEKAGIDFDATNLYVAQEMVSHWYKHSGYREWEMLAVEKEFEVPVGYGRRLKGRLDGIRKNGENTFIVEHKTASDWGKDGEDYLANLLRDDQASNYLFAGIEMSKMGIISCPSGIVYDIIEKPSIRKFCATPIELRKYTKDGRLYATQHDHDETPEEFRERVREWYAESVRVHVTFVYRTDRDLADAISDLNATMRDMASMERESTYYRNPAACKIFPCPYAPKCLENSKETDCLFVRKERKNEELG